MSSQSYNATTYSGFTTSSDGTGILPRFPLRDASDYIRLVKERNVRTVLKDTTNFVGPRYPLFAQLNSTRLIYNFGRIRCGTCAGGPLLLTAVGESP